LDLKLGLIAFKDNKLAGPWQVERHIKVNVLWV